MDDTASKHRRAWDAIPWVVNGSASDAVRQLVEAHVAACDDCRQELDFQQRLRMSFGVETVVAHDAGPGLQRLWSRIDAGPAAVPALSLTGTAPANKPAANWTRWLAVAVVVQAVGLVGVLALMRQPAASPLGAYETLSRAPVLPSAATLRFVPAPSLSMAELQTLLARSHTRIVESSADGGVFGLVPVAADTGADRPRDSEATGRALVELRAAHGVLLVEPIDAEPQKAGP